MPSVTAPRISRPRSSDTASSAVRSCTRRSRLPESSSSRRSLSTCVVMSVEMTPSPETASASPRTGKIDRQEVADGAVDRPVLGRLHRAAALEHPALEGLAARCRLEGQHVVVLPAEHLGRRPLEHAQPRLVRDEVDAVARLERHGGRGVVEDRALPALARLGLPARAREDVADRGQQRGGREAERDDRAARVAQRRERLVRVLLDDEADVEHGQPLRRAHDGHAAVVPERRRSAPSAPRSRARREPSERAAPSGTPTGARARARVAARARAPAPRRWTRRRARAGPPPRDPARSGSARRGALRDRPRRPRPWRRTGRPPARR